MNRALRQEWALLSGITALGLFLSKQNRWAGVLGLLSLGLRFLPTTVYSLNKRSVFITGGSRGLGFALAKNLLKRGAYLTLIARDPEELELAKTLLEDHGEQHVLIIECDATQPEQLTQALNRADRHFGGIDVLVNNAGTISVGPFESMEAADYDALIHLQLNAVVHAIQRTLPIFKRLGEGRIVNISSIGGMIPVPHMSAYCASKFALAGLSESVGLELAQQNVKVLTVYPGLMRTGSPIQAVFKGDHEKEYAWFSAGDVMPGLSVSAEYAAEKIVQGIIEGDSQLSFPFTSKIGAVAHVTFPETYALLMRQAARLMPHKQSTLRKTGAASKGWVEEQIWYRPFKHTVDKLESRYNQREKFDANFNLGA